MTRQSSKIAPAESTEDILGGGPDRSTAPLIPNTPEEISTLTGIPEKKSSVERAPAVEGSTADGDAPEASALHSLAVARSPHRQGS